MTQLPEGYTVREDRFLYTLVGPDGKDILSGLDAEACERCLYCLPEFGGVAYTHKIDAHVEL